MCWNGGSRRPAFGPESRAAEALRAAEDSILFLKSERLTEELGERAVELLVQEPDVQQAREIHARISRLVHYYRDDRNGAARLDEAFRHDGVLALFDAACRTPSPTAA